MVAFNNISAILWRSILLVEVTGGPEENHRLATGHRQALSHNFVSSIEYTLLLAGFKLTTIVMIDTDYTGICKSIYDHDHDHDGPITFYYGH